MALHPRIGELVRNGRTIFYTFLAGGVYVEQADAAELEAYIEAEERAPAGRLAVAAAASGSDFDSLPVVAGDASVVLTYALERIAAGEPGARFRGMRDGYGFSARADLFAIRCAWDAGCSFEALADGFGRGLGTMNGDWSGIRDSSPDAVVAMTAKAVSFLATIR